jgi:sterol desaturase/sphingolipid hydroxylase (fatty acid hydroxylase superfamily)
MLILIGVFLAGLLVFHALERRAPIKTDYRTGLPRRGYLADVTASLVDGPVLSSISKIIACGLIIISPRCYNAIGGWPWWLQFGVFFLVNDFGRYWLHRWYHEFNSLWRIHRVHHTVLEMDALSSSRVHLLEGVFKYALLVLPFHLVGIERSVVLVYSTIDILKGFWHHANLRTCIGPLNYLFNSAELHWWHHSTEARGQRANYGSILSIWDLIFGTFYWPRGQWPATIGVENMERFPDTYLGQLASVRFDDTEAARRFAASPAPGTQPIERDPAQPSRCTSVASVDAAAIPDGWSSPGGAERATTAA